MRVGSKNNLQWIDVPDMGVAGVLNDAREDEEENREVTAKLGYL